MSKPSKPRVSIIAALGVKTRAIGKAGGLLWKIPGDLLRFKALTMGHPIIMGRRTYESIGRALPDRTNIVISRSSTFAPLGGLTAKSLEEALEISRKSAGSEEIFIIGGGEIYTQALPATDRLYLTLVDSEEEGDTFFPEYPYFQKIISEETFTNNHPPYKYVILER